jgi:hypothetical protein
MLVLNLSHCRLRARVASYHDWKMRKRCVARIRAEIMLVLECDAFIE